MPDDPRVARLAYTLTEGAEALNCSVSTLKRSNKCGDAEFVYFGDSPRITTEEPERLAREGIRTTPQTSLQTAPQPCPRSRDLDKTPGARTDRTSDNRSPQVTKRDSRRMHCDSGIAAADQTRMAGRPPTARKTKRKTKTATLRGKRDRERRAALPA